jgi:hypothetical protein
MGLETPFKTPTARCKRTDDGCQLETWHANNPYNPYIPSNPCSPTTPTEAIPIDRISKFLFLY